MEGIVGIPSNGGNCPFHKSACSVSTATPTTPTTQQESALFYDYDDQESVASCISTSTYATTQRSNSAGYRMTNPTSALQDFINGTPIGWTVPILLAMVYPVREEAFGYHRDTTKEEIRQAIERAMAIRSRLQRQPLLQEAQPPPQAALIPGDSSSASSMGSSPTVLDTDPETDQLNPFRIEGPGAADVETNVDDANGDREPGDDEFDGSFCTVPSDANSIVSSYHSTKNNGADDLKQPAFNHASPPVNHPSLPVNHPSAPDDRDNLKCLPAASIPCRQNDDNAGSKRKKRKK